jgi:hypothetical protein
MTFLFKVLLPPLLPLQLCLLSFLLTVLNTAALPPRGHHTLPSYHREDTTPSPLTTERALYSASLPLRGHFTQFSYHREDIILGLLCTERTLAKSLNNRECSLLRIVTIDRTLYSSSLPQKEHCILRPYHSEGIILCLHTTERILYSAMRGLPISYRQAFLCNRARIQYCILFFLLLISTEW